MVDSAKPDGFLCPACKVELTMTERQGIEIDYCPKCRGVWLDRGELDKIIERSAIEDSQAAQAQSAPPPAQPYPPQDRYQDDYGRGYGKHGGGHHGRGKHSFLSRLFD